MTDKVTSQNEKEVEVTRRGNKVTAKAREEKNMLESNKFQ
jgi:hypothetical protein